MIIGKGGSVVRELQSKYRVLITVSKESSRETPDKKKITITGKRKEDVLAAKDEIYMEKVVIPVDENMIDFVCGPEDRNLEDFEKKSGVFNLRVDRGAQGKYNISAVGSVQNCEDLKALVQTQLSYYDSFQ